MKAGSLGGSGLRRLHRYSAGLRAAHHVAEGLGGGRFAEGAAVHPQLEQEAVGLADVTAGPDAEDLHDLVAVEVRTHGVELLLLGEHGDAGLQLVVGLLQPRRLLPVAGRAVGAGQDVQALELVAGVAHVAAHG